MLRITFSVIQRIACQRGNLGVVVHSAKHNGGIVIGAGAAITISQYKTHSAVAGCRVIGVGVFIADSTQQCRSGCGIRISVECDYQVSTADTAAKGTDRRATE